MPTSFSLRAKEEISREPFAVGCCVKSELAAFVRAAGTLEITSEGNWSFRLDTEIAAIAQRMYRLVRGLYGVSGQVITRERPRLGRRRSYALRVADRPAVEAMLRDTGVLAKEEEGSGIQGGIPAELVHRDCCRRAFARGAFLGSGSVTDPSRSYHAEFTLSDGDSARSLMLLLRGFELNAKTMSRKDAFVVYLKESEDIADLLNLVGATEALLEFENVRILKEIRNGVNRAVNCETANLGKTSRAAGRQAEAIRVIEAAGGFPALSPELRAIAELRLEYPEASLQELAGMVPKLGRSGVNHRLRKLCALAQELEDRKGERS